MFTNHFEFGDGLSHETLVVQRDPYVKPDPLHRLIDWDVTTDSVVATVTVMADRQTRRIIVDWGDTALDSITVPPGFEVPTAALGEPLPEGTYRFHHAYEAPEDGRAFTQQVGIEIDNADGTDESHQTEIELTPRYAINLYEARAALGWCDPQEFEDNSEFTFRQYVRHEASTQELVGKWSFSAAMQFPYVVRRLDQSQIRREVSWPFNDFVRWRVDEHDPGLDASGAEKIMLNPFLEDGRQSLEIALYDLFGGCKVWLRYSRESRLIAKLPAPANLTTYAPTISSNP